MKTSKEWIKEWRRRVNEHFDDDITYVPDPDIEAISIAIFDDVKREERERCEAIISSMVRDENERAADDDEGRCLDAAARTERAVVLAEAVAAIATP